MKKGISIIAIVIGTLVLISIPATFFIGAILEFQMKCQVAENVGIIGGADRPTAVMVTGIAHIGNTVIKSIVGIVLIVAGILGLRKR